VLGAVLALLAGWLGWALCRRILFPSDETTAVTARDLALVLFATGLLPVLHIVPLSVNVVAADRFLYVPLGGLALMSALAVSRLEPARSGRLLLLGGVIGALSVAGTLVRNRDYRSEIAFWTDAVRSTRAENTLPPMELANVFYRAQEHELALGMYMRVVRQMRKSDGEESDAVQPLANLANAQSALGHYDDALALSQRGLALGSRVPRHLYNVALVYLHRQEFEKTREFCRAALALYPDYHDARATLESSVVFEKQRDEIMRQPRREQLLNGAGYFARIGARTEAEQTYLLLLSREPAMRDEALDYLAMFGSPAALAATKGHRTYHPALQARLEARRATAEEARQARPLIERYLARYDARELGLASGSAASP
jgi:tetratricopeptide (TPR) repeat protein